MTAAIMGAAAILLFGHSALTAAEVCRPAQLKTHVEGVDGGLGHVGYALEVLNISALTCSLDGVPDLRIRTGRSIGQKIPVCANCMDYLFLQRPSEPVTVGKGESAWFLLGLTMSNEICVQPTAVEILLPGSSHPLEFSRLAEVEDGAKIAPGFVQFCGTVNVSAWRAGRFDRSICLTCERN